MIDEQRLAAIERAYAERLLYDERSMGAWATQQLMPLVAEVRRLREWVRFAATNMSYPDAQVQLTQALTGDGQPDWT